MKSAEDIESYLLRMDIPHEAVKPGMWVLKLDDRALAVTIAGTLVVFRLKVMDLPAGGREDLFRTLLTLNTSEMVHGAFGLEGDAVVIVHAVELENLDLHELQAVVDDISMAVAKYRSTLARYVAAPAAASAP